MRLRFVLGRLGFSVVKLPAPAFAEAVRAGRHRAGLPGNEDMIIGSAFLPAPAYWQEGGVSSRLARGARLGRGDG